MGKPGEKHTRECKNCWEREPQAGGTYPQGHPGTFYCYRCSMVDDPVRLCLLLVDVRDSLQRGVPTETVIQAISAVPRLDSALNRG